MTDGEDESGSRAVDRLTFFSDAVVAIAITLLAIDLPVPVGSTVSLFWDSVRDNSGHYAAFLISFLAIAAAWSQHHDIFRWVTAMDARLRTFNTGWLLLIVLTPFATKLLTSHGPETTQTHAVRFGFYALLQALESATVIALLRHLISAGQAPALPDKVASSISIQSYGLVAGFALSIPVFFVTIYGWVIWIILPVLAGHFHRLRTKRKAQSRGELEAS